MKVYSGWGAIALTALVFLGCDDGGGELTDGAVDMEFAPDAARPDGALPDANVPDSALPDADLPDGTLPDADVPDAALPDGATPECGDGNLDAGEACDDGNTAPGDGCDADCQIEPACGDGNLDAGEACDDGNTAPGDGCDADCQIEPACGDGNLDAGEACDDGNTAPGDGCDADCQNEPFCGDGNVDADEECDDGNNADDDGCDANCVLEPFCGDGNLDLGEACDDGNTDAGDGCDALCQIEPFCGDGNVDADEECDDGNNIDDDGCDSSCVLEPFCGDGNVDLGEACDDGNNDVGDGCDANCAIEPVCGDGTVDAGEECDDGNREIGDGCSAICELERVCRGEDCYAIGLCPNDDDLEENNSLATATPVLPGVYDGLALCDGGDFYKIELCDGGTIQVDLYFNHADGDIMLQLGNNALVQVVAISATDTDDERAEYTNDTGSRSRIDIFVRLGDGAGYAMEISIEGCLPEAGDVRLVDGDTPNQGRVEIFLNDEWGTVCDDSAGDNGDWGPENASVVCRQLGYASGAHLQTFGGGVGPIHLDDVGCVGDEQSLADCPARPIGENNCGHREDVGVICLLEGRCVDDGQCDPDAQCTAGRCVSRCGNGELDGPSEACDDGNLDEGDGCDAACQFENTCGDGNLELGEACDDGNVVDGDGCSADCNTIEAASCAPVDFEGADIPAPFVTDGDAPWAIDGGAASSGDIDDDQASSLRLPISTPRGAVGSFRYRVSSEARFDFLRFFIDDVEVAALSGQVDWTTFEFALAPGDHALEWRYTKDGSADRGEDRGLIDDLLLSDGAPCPDGNPPACPEGGRPGLDCFIINGANRHGYMRFSGAFVAVRAIAEQFGGYLASITSQEEQDFLADPFGVGRVWIGLTDEAEEGTYVWDSGEAFDFAAWCPGEPTGGAEDYVEFGLFDSDCWNDTQPTIGVNRPSGALVEVEGF